MNKHPNATRGAIAAALFCMAGTALAQTYTLMSPPLPWAHQHLCTLTNVSSQAVSVQRAEIVDRGTVLWDGSNACTGNLAAGRRCVFQTVAGSGVSRQPYCRVQYTGNEGALVASFYGNYQNHVGGSPGAVTALPLQSLKTITLATAN